MNVYVCVAWFTQYGIKAYVWKKCRTDAQVKRGMVWAEAHISGWDKGLVKVHQPKVMVSTDDEDPLSDIKKQYEQQHKEQHNDAEK